MTSAPARFWSKVDLSSPQGCWLWTASLGTTGYGQFNAGSGRIVKAHRWAYEWMVGPIPDGLTIDHLCRVTTCVNPSHLEPVTLSENVRRGDGPTALNARKTHCPQGHPFDEANTRWDRGYRGCWTCIRAHNTRTVLRRSAERRARKAEA